MNFQCHKQDEARCPSKDPHFITYAYVMVRTWPYRRPYGDVHICEAGLKMAYNMQELSATILHEMSHRLDKTRDHQYCWKPGCDLPSKTAVDNADSYSRYARDIFNTTM